MEIVLTYALLVCYPLHSYALIRDENCAGIKKTAQN